jgi:hypothetical protein
VLTDLFRALAESEAGQALGQMGGKARAAGLFGTLISELTETLDPAQLEIFQRQQQQALEGLLGGVRFAEAALRTGND